MIKKIIIFVLFCFNLSAQDGFMPIQFQPSLIKGGTFIAKLGATNEIGDSMWLYQHDSLAVHGTYNATTNVLTVYLNNGSTATIDLSDLATGGTDSTTVTDSGTIDFTKTGNDITAIVKTNSIDSTHIKPNAITSSELSSIGTAGSYNNVTTDADGRVTSGSTVAYLTTEVDGSTTNELDNVTTNLTISGTSSPLTIVSSDGTDVTVTAGTGISLSGSSSNMTITNSGIITEVDGSTTNEKITSVTFAPSTKILSIVENGITYSDTITITPMDSTYNGNRAITRVPTVGTNTGATTFREWLNWWYINSYQQPTLSMNSLSPSIVEVGSSTAYTISGSTSNPCAYTLSNGAIASPSHSFGSNTTYSKAYTHAPTSAGTTTITATQDWVMTTSTCEAGSPTSGTKSASQSITNVYPLFWGMSATDYSSASITYSDFTTSGSPNDLYKSVTTQGSKSGLTMTGTNKYIYLLLPKSWSDYTISQITDHNGFNVTPSFTSYDVNITSTGLTNNWTQAYKLYKLNNLTTASAYAYSFTL